MFLFADSESDAEGEPARLSEEQLAEQVRQSREKLADQTHPHEARARYLVNNQSRRDNSAEEHMDIDESRIRKENRRDERVRHVRFENTYNERRSNTTEEEGQGDYSEMETEGKGLELESCPYGCPYKSSDTWLIKAHLTRCPNKDSQSGTGEMPMTMQNQFAKHMVKSHTREVKAMVDDNLNILCKARFWPTPASLQALYAAMPSKAEPVRHNYNYSECGLTVNNVGLSHMLLSRCGLPQKKIDDILLHVGGDREQYDVIRSLISRMAKQDVAHAHPEHHRLQCRAEVPAPLRGRRRTREAEDLHPAVDRVGEEGHLAEGLVGL